MPVRTEVPIEGRILKYLDSRNFSGDPANPVGTMDMSHFEVMYGWPLGVNGITCTTDYEPGADGELRAFLTFRADTPDEQILLDTWAAQVDRDDIGIMRAKFKAAPSLMVEGGEYKPPEIGVLTMADAVVIGKGGDLDV